VVQVVVVRLTAIVLAVQELQVKVMLVALVVSPQL
jgi:hypothetical protein